MKVLASIFALAVVLLPDALVSGVRADQHAAVRGRDDGETPKSDAIPSVNADHDDRELHGGKRDLAQIGEATLLEGRSFGGDAVESDHYYKSYRTGSCTCARDAYMKVYETARSELKMIPLLPIYPVLENRINELVDYAVCLLHSVDCGCEDGRFAPYKIINKYKVSTYRCCCDVNAMRDVIIESIMDLARSWKMKHEMGEGGTMVAVVDEMSVVKRNSFNVYTSIVERTAKYAEKIGGIYQDTDPLECLRDKCPCYDIADMYSQIVQDGKRVSSCAITSDGTYVEITGAPPATDYAFCVGEGCSEHDEDGLRCWAGEGVLDATPPPLFEFSSVDETEEVTDDDTFALCSAAITTFCKRNNVEIQVEQD